MIASFEFLHSTEPVRYSKPITRCTGRTLIFDWHRSLSVRIWRHPTSLTAGATECVAHPTDRYWKVNSAISSSCQHAPLYKTHAKSNQGSLQWAINITYHTTLCASPTQLVFGCDMVMPMTYLANWAAIQHHHQSLSKYDNICENSICMPHEILCQRSHFNPSLTQQSW